MGGWVGGPVPAGRHESPERRVEVNRVHRENLLLSAVAPTPPALDGDVEATEQQATEGLPDELLQNAPWRRRGGTRPLE